MNVNAKEYLLEIRSKRRQLERLKNRRKDLHLDVSFGAIAYDADHVQSSPKNKLEEAMVKLSNRMAYLDRKIAELSVEIDDRINSIESLENVRYRDVLYKVYVEYKSFEEISVEMKYTYKYTRNLHGEALNELAKNVYFS